MLAELFSMSKVGMFPSYKVPFDMVPHAWPVVREARAGVLVEEEPGWCSEEGLQRRPQTFHFNCFCP